MEPTFFERDIILISSLPYWFGKPHYGDIVIFKKEKKYFIKRIQEVRKNIYFVAGDNRGDSFDSRKFGTLARKEILGKVIYKI